MASPSAAHRVCPRCRGPVGLAEMYSRLMTWPASDSLRPYAGPASTMVRASSPAEAASRVMLRKPGPATSTALTPSTAPRRSASCVASSRGGTPAPLASCIATLVDQSPWSRLRGRSTRTCSGTSTRSSPSATASARAVRMAAESSSGVTRTILGRGRCAPAAGHEAPDQRDEVVGVERLGEERVQARALGLGPVVLLDRRGHHDDGDAGQAGVLPDPGHRPPPVPGGHLRVEGDDVGQLLGRAQPAHECLAVADLLHVVALELEVE